MGWAGFNFVVMKEVRPRLPEYIGKYADQLRQLSEAKIKRILADDRGDFYRLLIFSDVHGVLVDRKAFDCLLAILRDNHFDEVLANGDILDFPYLSNHAKSIRRINDQSDRLRNYSEIQEIEFTKNNILRPIREATKAKIVMRIGNHEERICTPKRYTKDQLERLNEVFICYDSSRLDKILELPQIGIEYDPEPVRSYYDIFDVVHGLSLSKYAPFKNIEEYMRSGSSGHSHRLNSTYYTKRDKYYCWLESGCLRTREQVEYFPTAKIPNWQNGFVTVTFDLREEKTRFHAKTHAILEGRCEFGGVVYSWRDLK